MKSLSINQVADQISASQAPTMLPDEEDTMGQAQVEAIRSKESEK